MTVSASGNLLQSGAWDWAGGEWITSTENAYVWNAASEDWDLAETSDGLGRTSHYVYDATGRIVESGIGSATTEYDHDSQGRWVRTTSALGKEVEYAYYGDGYNLHTVENASGTTHYEYDEDNEGPHLTRILDATNNKTEFQYDERGRLVATLLYNQAPDPENPGQMQYSLSSTAQYAYDMFGRLASATDFKGQGKDFVYDVLGRLTNKYYGSVGASTRIAYTYDDFGYLTQIDSWCGASCQDTIRYEYDSEGRLQYRTGVGYGSIGYFYDKAGRPGMHTWPAAPPSESVAPMAQLNYTYDKAGRVSAIHADSGPLPLAQYQYNAAGQTEVVELENGALVEMDYDATYGRLASLVNRALSGSVMTSFAYTYNLDGYVTEVEREDSSTIAYQYDGVGRLIDEQRDGSGTSYHNHFEYDPVGNRVSWVRADETFEGEQTHAYLYNGLNQLVSHTSTGGQGGSTELYAYDLNGNLTEKAVYSGVGEEMSLSETWLYEWDSEDRLVKVIKKNSGGTVASTVEYAYCPACGGSRTHKMVYSGVASDANRTKWLQYETEGLNQLRVDERWDSNASGTITDADDWRTERVSYNGPGQIQQMLKETIYTYPSNATNVPSAETPIYYNYDRMGVVAGLSNAAGAELQQFESDAFGSWDGLNTYTTRRITGKEYDEDTGLYFFEARWYESSKGRFVSRDAVRQVCIAPTHPYSVAESQPLGLYDPDGHFAIRTPEDGCGKCTEEQMAIVEKSVISACGKMRAVWAGYGSFLPKIQRDLYGCISRACDQGTVICNNGTEYCEGAYGYQTDSRFKRWWHRNAIPGTVYGNDAINVCYTNVVEGPGVSYLGMNALHEWGHTCGCTHNRTWPEWAGIDDYLGDGFCSTLPQSGDTRGWLW